MNDISVLVVTPRSEGHRRVVRYFSDAGVKARVKCVPLERCVGSMFHSERMFRPDGYDAVVIDDGIAEGNVLAILDAVRDGGEKCVAVIADAISEDCHDAYVKSGAYAVIAARYLRSLPSMISREVLRRSVVSNCREQGDQWRAICEASTHATIIHRGYQPLFVSDRWAAMHGYSREEVLDVGTIQPMILGDHHAYVSACWGEAVHWDEGRANIEYQAIHRNGERFWCESRMQPTDWNGVSAIQSTLLDITERRTASEKLRRSEQRFHDVATAASDWIWEIDDELHFTYVSDRVFELTGISPSQILGRSRLEIGVESADKLVWAHHVADLLARRPFRDFRYTFVDESGANHFFSANGVPVFDNDGTFLGYRGTAKDLTAEVTAQCALRESEEQFRSAFDTAPYGMVLSGVNGEILLANTAFLDIVGCSADDLRRLSFGDLYHREDRAKARELTEQALAGTAEAFQWEARLSYRDGGAVSVLLSSALVRDSNGKPLRFVSQIVDLSERKSHEERLRASQKMEAVGQLTSGIAHDFNNLLTVILGNVRLLERGLATHERYGKKVAAVRDAAKRGADLVHRLLAFCGRQQLEPEIVEPQRLIEALKSLLSRTLGESIDVKTSVGDANGDICVDRTGLESALLNLALNARDAMPAGGVLSISIAQAQERDFEAAGLPATQGSSDYVLISVADTGAGIPEEHLDHIFEPFFTTKEVGRGTGLGLSMVHGFVEQSGGFICVESNPGAGTTFRLFLPITHDIREQCVGSSEHADSRPEGHETVLIAEDQDDVRAFAATLLGELGYHVLQAKDGRDALHILQKEQPIDLLFSDIVMPGGMNGFELARSAKHLQPDLRVLLGTGHGDDVLALDSTSDELDAILRKPYDDRALACRIRQVLDA